MNENKSSVQYNSRNLPLPISYDCNGNIMRLSRCGLVDAMHGGYRREASPFTDSYSICKTKGLLLDFRSIHNIDLQE